MIEPWDDAKKKPILDENEVRRMMVAYIAGCKEVPSEDELLEFVQWASNAKLAGIVYDLIERGWLAPTGMEGPDNPMLSTNMDALERINDAYRKLEE